jgi:hypothetical protein
MLRSMRPFARVPEPARGSCPPADALAPRGRARACPSWARPLALALGVGVTSLAAGCTQTALVGRDNELPRDASIDAPGFIDGRVHAHAVFNEVRSILWIGAADPSRIELYIYEVAATCDEISKAGWVTKTRPGDLMGITVGGTTPGTYTVEPEDPPTPGKAYVLHVIDQTDPTIESTGETGTVVITSVKPGESVTGTIDASFVTGTTAEGSLGGDFTATWCPTGVGL